MADLPGAVIVVTGASSGIGRATALGFARKGARLVLVSRSADALDKVARECADLGSEAVTFAADMADDAAVERMRSFAVSRFGRIDVWVNCAAVLLLGRFEEIAPPLQSGAERPYRMQSLLGRSHWDADRLRDEVRDYVVEALGDEDGVLIVDETGFVKKGDRSAGVARQYSGTAGRIENSHVGVFFAYASRYGQALVDRFGRDVPERRSRRWSSLRPSQRWRAPWSRRRSMPASRALTFWATLSTGRTAAFAGCWKLASSPMSWRFEALTSCAGEGIACLRKPRPRNWPASSSPTTGSVMRQVKAPKGLGSTTGHASAALGRQKAASSIGFSSAASDRHPEKKPTTWSSPRPVPPWPNWRQWPACAGRSRSVLSAPRMISDLIIARLGPGTDGIAT